MRCRFRAATFIQVFDAEFNMSSQLHVVFGAGSLGYAVAAASLANGHQVRIASRSGRADAPPGATVAKADATDPKAVQAACEGASALIFCAAPPYTDWLTQYPAMQRGVVDGAAAAGARLVTAENVYVYGRTDAPMTEDTPWNPNSKKGELRARLNQELLDAHRAGKVQVALGRAPDYYGPRATLTTVYGDQVFGRAIQGKAANVFGDIEALHTFAYVDDFARGLVALAETPAAAGQVWHVPCAPPLTQRAMLEHVYAAAGGPMNARAMPGFMLTVLGWFMPIMRELGEMDYQWRMTYDFRHDKFDAAFPDVASAVVGHADGAARTVARFRNPKG